MNIQHTTRTGKTYYLHGGRGKSGKPNYFFSTDPNGPPEESWAEINAYCRTKADSQPDIETIRLAVENDRA